MSSPQPPDGGQQDQQPQGAGDQPGPGQSAEGGDATQVVRPAQPQNQQADAGDSTQVVPPAGPGAQPMYQQPGQGGPGGGDATSVVPPSMQPAQPMYQQPGTQSQPGGFPAQPPQQPGTPGGGFQQPGTPGGGFQQPGGFPPPQAQGGYGAPAPAAYGPSAQDNNRTLGMASAWSSIGFGGLLLLFAIFGIVGLVAAANMISGQAAQYGVEVPSLALPITLQVIGLIVAIAIVVGGVLTLKQMKIGPLVSGSGSALMALSALISMFMYFQVLSVFQLLIAAAVAVLAFLPGTRQWVAGGAAASAPGGFAAPGQQGGFGQQQFGQQPPQQFGQQQPPQYGGQPPQYGQQPPQQFGQQPPQQGGFPPGQQPPQW